VGQIRITYYIVRNGRGFWNPTKAMKTAGFAAVPCGPDGPEAWRIAREWSARWEQYRKGCESALPLWPHGSLGDVFERYREMDAWKKSKAPKTRAEWEAMWSKYIGPIFGDRPWRAASLEQLDRWYASILATKGVREAHRAMKIWRALFVVAAAMHKTVAIDPSSGIRRKTPRPRTAIWSEGEAVRLIKGAWRMGYRGLAALLAVAWDSQFAPIDCRSLTPAQMTVTKDKLIAFAVGRAKTGASAIGTLCKRSQRLLEAYIAGIGVELLPNVPILRNRSGGAYTKETLNKDFDRVRTAVLGKFETRRIMDMRRSGAVEAMAGNVDDGALAAKMANTISQAAELQRTYLPVDPASVARADAARLRGRAKLRSENKTG
jgi:hypothetical protein